MTRVSRIRSLAVTLAFTLALLSGNASAAAISARQDTAADQTAEKQATQKTPRSEDINHISVSRSALAPRDKNDVTLIREDKTRTFGHLAKVLVERGFFDLADDHNKDEYAPDMDIMRITVYYGSPSQRKIVTRWIPSQLDDAWEFEMLIRGAANRCQEELKTRQRQKQ